jgi:hypothetical protein
LANTPEQEDERSVPGFLPSGDWGSRVPTPFMDDAEYWRKRAEEARTLAEQMKDTHAKSLMLGIAESYEKIANWTTERTGGPR